MAAKARRKSDRTYPCYAGLCGMRVGSPHEYCSMHEWIGEAQ